MLILQQNRRQTTSDRPGFTLTGPITITRVLTKFTTFAQPTSISSTTITTPTTVSPSIPFKSVIPPPSRITNPIVSLPPRPSSTPPREALEEQQPATNSRSGVPTRAVIAAVLGGLTLILLVLFFFLRRRAIGNRKRMRSIWTQSTLVQLPPRFTSPVDEKAKRPSRTEPKAGLLMLSVPSQHAKNDLREDWRLSSIGRPMSILTPLLSPQLAPPRSKSQMTESYRSSEPLSLTPITISSDAMSLSASVPSLMQSVVPGSASALSFQEAGLPFAPYDASVVSTYLTALADELRIAIGESVRVLKEFSDGWCYCENGRGERGAAPKACLRPSDAGTRLTVPGRYLEFDRSSFGRGSSLGVASILAKDDT